MLMLHFGECFARTSRAKMCGSRGFGRPCYDGCSQTARAEDGRQAVSQTEETPHEPVVVPPLVPEVAGVSRTRLRKYDDYVVVSDTLEGLGVLGGAAAADGSSVGAKPVDDKKRKGDTPLAGDQKAPKLRRTRGTAIPKATPAVTTETREEPVHLFATPPSSPKAADVEVQKEDRRSPSIEMVTPPPVRAEDTAKKPVVEIITDTLDSSNNLIDLHDAEGQWDEKPKSPVAEKLKSPVVEQPYGSTAAGTGVEDQPYIQPSETELEFYYRSYAVDRGLDYHHPPWTVMQGDDVSNDPLACRDILRGLGTPFEVLRARSLPRENRVNQLSSMLVGSSIIANAIMEYYNALGRREEETTGLRAEAEAMMKAAREGVERLKKDRAAFEKLKQTVGLKQVPDECKGWREACARENEKLFCVRQELTNLKAANAVLMKEKAAAEAAAKEAETRASKVLEEADADRTKLNKVEVQNRVTILEEVTACASEPEARVREAAEVRDGLITSLNRLKADRDWKRDHCIGHITTRCLPHPQNATAVNELKDRARQAGFKAGYKECLSHVNPFYKSRFTDERSGFHGINTESLRNVWRRKITWTVCGCCMNDLRRRKPLVARRMVREPVVHKQIRLGQRAFFYLFDVNVKETHVLAPCTA
ncbi:hypothetical protein HanLR1_Chr02g0046981 [Helianthus annuus]|nr:hypothetical protein HanLR1_Chr02g0046981 [Helianthus annuus]